MKSMRSWQAIVVGAVLAVAIGSVLVVGVGFPICQQEMGGFIALMHQICFWGCTPALLLPFVAFSIARRVPPRRIMLASLVAGVAFPIFLGAVLLVLPYLFHGVGLVGVAALFDTDLDDLEIFDVRFWIALMPFALVIGTVLSHFVLAKRKVRTV
ncbi:hypothetical protein ACFL5Q_03215 [Planctomycetota bacterium]